MECVFEIFPTARKTARQLLARSRAESNKCCVGPRRMAKRVAADGQPSLGLAPLLTREFFRVSSQLREYGNDDPVVEQNAQAELAVADRAI